jgi:hypothetical protein
MLRELYNSLTSLSYTLTHPLTVPHMRYTSYLATVPPRGAAGSSHVVCEVKLWLIRTWGSVWKTRKKKMLTFIVYKTKKILNKRIWSLLGNSGKPVTLETLSLTKFSKHVFQEQGIRDSWKPGTCEASNSRMCRVWESWFGEEVESRTCGSPESQTVDGPNFGERPIRESVEDPVRESGAWTCANQLRSDGQFGKLLKTLFGSFMRRHSRTRREAKSKL